MNIRTLPITARRSIEMVGVVALGYVIIMGQSIIMPLLMAFFLSLLLLPLVRWLRRHRIPESISIIIAIIALLAVMAGIVTFFSIQIGKLLSDIPTIKENLMVHWNSLSVWINQKLHFTAQQQIAAINKQMQGAGNNAMKFATGAAVSFSGVLIFVGLLPIYIFLILYYKNTLLRFAFLWFENEETHPKVEAALRETEGMVKYYLIGLLIQIAYLTILVSGGLALFGIRHALLIGAVFAILNLIPYVGALVGNVIGVLLTLTSSQELWQIWAVLGTIAAVQFFDNNIFMPAILGSRVKVNPLASIVGIIIGGAMAGISGMFLSIPMLAVLKIMFDKSAHLKQWGVLIGDSRPPVSPITARMFRIRRPDKVESGRPEGGAEQR